MIKYLAFTSLACMACLTYCTSCGIMPQLASEAENIIDDDAITIKCSREALGRQTNVRASIELDNGQSLTK